MIVLDTPPTRPDDTRPRISSERTLAVDVLDRFLTDVHRTASTRLLDRRMRHVETAVRRVADRDTWLQALVTRLSLFREHWPAPPRGHDLLYDVYCQDLDALVSADLPRLRTALTTGRTAFKRPRPPRTTVRA